MLLLTFPELKQEQGAVTEALKSARVKDDVMQTWRELISQDLVETNDEDEFD